MLIWLLATALAQDPVNDADSDVDATIIVYGDAALAEARAQVSSAFADLGWQGEQRGDTIVFKPPENWIGKATFLPDGRFEFSTPLIPIRGADLGASGQPGGDGMRGLPRDTCGSVDRGDEVVIRSSLAQLDGSSYVGPVNVLFSVYVSQNSDTAIWSESHIITFADNQFSVPIGTTNALDDVDVQGGGYWIGMTPQGEVERSRVPLTNVAVVRDLGRSDGPCSPSPTDYDPFAQVQPSAGAVASVGTHIGPSRERRYARIREVLDASADEVSHYREVVQATATQDKVAELPERLDSLWTDGRPLYGSKRIRKQDERREAVLEHWATRAENMAGRLVCRTIETWLANVVLYSEDPITEGEYLEYEARRTDGRRLPRNPVMP